MILNCPTLTATGSVCLTRILNCFAGFYQLWFYMWLYSCGFSDRVPCKMSYSVQSYPTKSIFKPDQLSHSKLLTPRDSSNAWSAHHLVRVSARFSDIFGPSQCGSCLIPHAAAVHTVDLTFEFRFGSPCVVTTK